MSMKNYLHTISANKATTFEWHKANGIIQKEITLGELAQMIIDRQYNHFDYDTERSGCSSHVKLILRMLENNQILKKGTYKRILAEFQAWKAANPGYWVPEDDGSVLVSLSGDESTRIPHKASTL